MNRITGVIAPVTTPFDPITGEIDVVGLRSNVRHLLDAGLSGIVLFGSTGEGPLLDDEERVAALEALRDVVDPDRPLLAGIAAESTRQAIGRARLLGGAGADAVMLAPPSYYRPQHTPEALREHYLAVANASPVPVLVYQVPTVYSGADLKPGLVAELSKHANLIGIKDSTGDLPALGELATSCSRDFSVIVGNGAFFYPGLVAGACGGILAIAAFAAAECVRLFDLQQQGRDAEAGALQERLGALHRAVVGQFGVPGVKAAVELRGGVGGPPRMPLLPLKDKERAAVATALEAAGLGAAGAVTSRAGSD